VREARGRGGKLDLAPKSRLMLMLRKQCTHAYWTGLRTRVDRRRGAGAPSSSSSMLTTSAASAPAPALDILARAEMNGLERTKGCATTRARGPLGARARAQTPVRDEGACPQGACEAGAWRGGEGARYREEKCFEIVASARQFVAAPPFPSMAHPSPRPSPLRRASPPSASTPPTRGRPCCSSGGRTRRCRRRGAMERELWGWQARRRRAAHRWAPARPRSPREGVVRAVIVVALVARLQPGLAHRARVVRPAVVVLVIMAESSGQCCGWGEETRKLKRPSHALFTSSLFS
jgi:hypothetical protein